MKFRNKVLESDCGKLQMLYVFKEGMIQKVVVLRLKSKKRDNSNKN